MGHIYWSCCLNATSLSPLATAKALGLDIPPTMMRRLGHNECGIYAEVTAGGTIGVGDAVATEASKLL